MSHFIKTCILFLLSYASFSQEGDFYGKVKFNNNEPGIDVFVVIKGAHFYKETVTDFNGEFYIKSIPYGTHKIQFHSLNSKRKIITALLNTKKKEVNLSLELIKNQLDEVRITTKTEKTKKETQGFAVNVIKTKEASLRNIQTNELLNTTVGVKIRQNGGLGSEVKYSINGLSGSAVRIFIDGIPISTYGSSFSLNSIPPSMIKNIEVYKGVVPGHLADDALGGAINIILHKGAKTNFNISTSYGSFNTSQTSFNGLYRFKESGLTLKGSLFHNYSDNDYTVTGRSVLVTGLGGAQTPITAKRFNDAYRSTGGMAQIGFTDVKWADQFLIGFTGSDDYKEVQHGAFMTITPYKGRFLKSNALLANLTYQKKDLFTKGLNINVNGMYGKRNRVVNDTVAWAYSWNGKRAIDFRGNEYKYTWESQSEQGPTLLNINRKVTSIRTGLSYEINKQHKVFLNHLYNGIDREDSDELVSVLENTFKGTRDLTKNIYALTYEMNAFDNKLKTSFFGKYYQQKTTSIDPDIETNSDGTQRIVDKIISSNKKFDGYGLALSYAIKPNITVLTSAEKAVRLPNETEVFGDNGDNVVENSFLNPEHSNNFNIGFRFGSFNFKKHDFTISTNLFTRNIKDRIGLPIINSTNVDNDLIIYVNQGSGTSKGIEAQLNYSYNNNFGLNFNLTRFDIKIMNKGVEIAVPNTPFFTMNGSLRYSFKNVIQKKARLNLFYTMYFTDEFNYLNIPSGVSGADFFKVPKQFAQDLGLSYAFPNKKLVASFDVKNIFDKPVYDNLSVQKPGRAFYLKLNYTINKF
ncbi:TonB-dependent receptor [Polaribacter staleyi]|uniref:TonB-dependent receptor n=1 Tax=Polaribacter staleyi TaxID=2022337 RepID=UPI0031BB7A8E